MDDLAGRHDPIADPAIPSVCLCGLPMSARTNIRHQPDGEDHVIAPVVPLTYRRRVRAYTRRPAPRAAAR